MVPEEILVMLILDVEKSYLGTGARQGKGKSASSCRCGSIMADDKKKEKDEFTAMIMIHTGQGIPLQERLQKKRNVRPFLKWSSLHRV